jgi:adenylate cyclase
VSDQARPRRSALATVRAVHLWAGLVLLTYVTTHLLNHALGLVSLTAMEAGRGWLLAPWRSLVGTAVLYAAFVTHPLLALWSLYRRRDLRMPGIEAWRLLLGLCIPPLLAPHIVANRLGVTWLGLEDSYARVLAIYWVLRPDLGLAQALTLTLVWLHASIGIHFWLRLRPWYPRAVLPLFAAAVLLPVLALLGGIAGGREVAARAPFRSPAPAAGAGLARAGAPLAMRLPDRATGQRLARITDGIVGTYGVLLAAALGARGLRAWGDRRRGRVRVGYPDGRRIAVPLGFSVLEASRLAAIPHASVCGGRGRCSTCRVRVTRGGDAQPPPSLQERRVLARVGAPPGVRLGCQLRPTADLEVVPLITAPARVSAGYPAPSASSGTEQEIVVLFADLRGFTRIAERRLPYDVVFLLNRYFEAVGTAIQSAGGLANQFTGDGVMALFGVGAGADAGCREALVAAGRMVDRLEEMSRSFGDELVEPLRLGIGIHVGPAVVGRMGHAETMYFTAVGDTVHVASRLQELTKTYQCQAVISEEVARRAEVDVSALPRHEVTVRNRTAALAVRVVADVRATLTPSARKS